MSRYTFIDPIKGSGKTEDGIYYTEGWSEEELDAKVETLIDPTLDQEPQPGDPKSIYPLSCGDDPTLKRKWEKNYLIVRRELPPLRLLPEGSLLRDEWFRRAEILREEKERILEERKNAIPLSSEELAQKQERDDRVLLRNLETLAQDARKYFHEHPELLGKRLERLTTAIEETKQRMARGYSPKSE
ncbi:MAG: hypothetical protein EOP06_12085 [Proteobacteria bacterium]|nr:MAG: hypothetical protein EOP06_12085 [Pseudomonadota bacterium]